MKLRVDEVLGGIDPLARRLQVHPALLMMWMRGSADLPEDVFLKVVDIVLEHDFETTLAARYNTGDETKA